jgi:hypothetical protein
MIGTVYRVYGVCIDRGLVVLTVSDFRFQCSEFALTLKDKLTECSGQSLPF